MRKKKAILPLLGFTSESQIKKLPVMLESEIGKLPVGGRTNVQPVEKFLLNEAKKNPDICRDFVGVFLTARPELNDGRFFPDVSNRELLSLIRVAHHLSRFDDSGKWASIKQTVLDLLEQKPMWESTSQRFAQYQSDLRLCKRVLQACSPHLEVDVQALIEQLGGMECDAIELQATKIQLADVPEFLRTRPGRKQSWLNQRILASVHLLRRCKHKRPEEVVSGLGGGNVDSIRRMYFKKKRSLGESGLDKFLDTWLLFFLREELHCGGARRAAISRGRTRPR